MISKLQSPQPSLLPSILPEENDIYRTKDKISNIVILTFTAVLVAGFAIGLIMLNISWKRSKKRNTIHRLPVIAHNSSTNQIRAERRSEGNNRLLPSRQGADRINVRQPASQRANTPEIIHAVSDPTDLIHQNQSRSTNVANDRMPILKEQETTV